MDDSETDVASTTSTLSDDEWKVLQDLHQKATTAAGDAVVATSTPEFQKAVEEALPSLSPTLIMKLRSGSIDSGDKENEKVFLDISNIMQGMLQQIMETARDTLAELLNAGEIKKLDALIGKAAREKKLDVAFFQVLQMNLQDAALEQQQQQPEESSDGEEDNQANRFQILQHIYTRCQEEVEKTINPGLALLNKLLRTEVDSIRRNQLEHYLCPQSSTITTPDGKELELESSPNQKSLVDHQDFCEAIGNAVRQIRTVEKAGGTDREVAANMVESCRQVAKEARIVIGEHFGKDSEQLKSFEDALMPVFRPSSPDSEYIQGEA